MRGLILISVVCLQIGWSYGEPKGVGAVAYQDTAGNRYGGTYDFDDAQFNQIPGGFFPHFAQPQPFQNIDDFFPEYFSNLENLLKDTPCRRASFRKARALGPLSPLKSERLVRSLFPLFPPLPPLRPFPPLPPLRPLFSRHRSLFPFQPLPPLQHFEVLPPLNPLGFRRTFQTNLENQMLAFTAAKKAYDITSNQAGYIPNFPSRYNNLGAFGAFPGFGYTGPNMNSAFASGVAGPGFTHQIAAIDPKNPKKGNVNVVNRFGDTEGNKPGFYSVQSSSFSSSSDIGGKRTNHRRAETIVNNDGKITAYKVEN